MNKPTSKYITKYRVRLKTKVKLKLAACGVLVLASISGFLYWVQTSEFWQIKQAYVYKNVGMYQPEKILLSASKGGGINGSAGWFRLQNDNTYMLFTSLILKQNKKYCIIEIIKNGKHLRYIVGFENECTGSKNTL
jgi:hypothetical protein